MSWLSGLAATPSPSSAAISRTRDFGRAPSGKRRKSNCPASWRTGNSSGRAPDRRRDAVPRRSPLRPADIMAGRQTVGAQIARQLQQVGEFRPILHWTQGMACARPDIRRRSDRPPGAETVFMVEDIMRDAQAIAHRARVADVAPRAAGARAAHRLAMVIELQGDADRLGPRGMGERGHHRAVDAARHRDHDPLGPGEPPS